MKDGEVGEGCTTSEEAGDGGSGKFCADRLVAKEKKIRAANGRRTINPRFNQVCLPVESQRVLKVRKRRMGS
jgi:hypothetical protein